MIEGLNTVLRRIEGSLSTDTTELSSTNVEHKEQRGSIFDQIHRQTQKELAKKSPKKKMKKMADAGTLETTQQLDTGDKNHTPNLKDNEDETQNTDPIYEMYLPDLNNTPLSQALKTGLDYRMEDKVMVQCPKLKQYYGVDTFLVQRLSGQICIYTNDECKLYPINCSRTKFAPSLLEKAL